MKKDVVKALNKIKKGIEDGEYHSHTIKPGERGWEGETFIHRGELLTYLDNLIFFATN